MMKHRLHTYCIALSLLAVCGCGAKHTKDPEIRDIVPVKVTIVSESQLSENNNYIGTAVPGKSALLSCSYPGTLTELNIRKGSIVRKGDKIANIESQSVISSAEMAAATLKQAEDGYKRVVQVHESGSIPEVKLVEVQTQLAKARAADVAARKALENCTITAPFDGVIDEVFIEQGVETGAMSPVARILDISSVEIEFSVPEKEIGNLECGDTLFVEIPALGSKRFPTTLKAKGIQASAVSHSYLCTLRHNPAIKGLLPGMVCKVKSTDNNSKSTIIPASTIRTDSKGRYVWSVTDGIVQKKYVKVQAFSGKGVLISEGLHNGDTIITEGSQKVSSGMRVKIVE